MSRRPSSLVLAIDLGSSSVRAALFTQEGTRILPSTASRKYSIDHSAEGGAELAAPVLLRAAKTCLAETLRWRRNSVALRQTPIIAIAGSAFWHSLLALGRDNQPISPIFTWADSRATSDAAELRERLSERTIHRRTGCMLRAPYWPAKLRWLRQTQSPLFRRAAAWVSPASWIFRELFGVNATSHSIASGTGLYDLRATTWDADLCELCGLREDQLGVLGDSEPAFNSIQAELHEVPVFTAIGDGAASNLGSGAESGGRIAINIGTSAAVRKILLRGETRSQVRSGLFKHVVDPERMVVGGAISNGGNLRQWCLRELKLTAGELGRALSRTAAATDTLTVLPFWVSERAPTWPEGVRGTITGLTHTDTAADILRAATTSTFYRLAEILSELRTSPARAEEIIVSGGVLHSPALLSILADCIGHDIRVCRELESSLRGAAILALQKLGFEPKPLLAGRVIRHNPSLAVKHQSRHAQQMDLERRLR